MINSFSELTATIQDCRGDISSVDWEDYGGQVNVQQKDDLILFNYMRECQYKKPSEWNWFERVSRGLVMNTNGRVVARPFDKFWNYGEVIPEGNPVEITEKMDGSLGIIFWYRKAWQVVTRGSFVSEQAEWAQRFLSVNYDLLGTDYNLTLLVEIIYPENQIVIDYDGKMDLVLLGVRNRANGDDWPFKDVKSLANCFGFNTPTVYDLTDIDLLLERAKELGPDHEGWVVRYSDGTRVKVKGSTYLELHRWISNLSSKSVAKAMIGLQLDELYKTCPKYLKDDLDAIVETIEITVRQTKEIVLTIFNRAPKDSRKEFALWVRDQAKEWSHYLFAMYDDKFTTELILKKEYRV